MKRKLLSFVTLLVMLVILAYPAAGCSIYSLNLDCENIYVTGFMNTPLYTHGLILKWNLTINGTQVQGSAEIPPLVDENGVLYPGKFNFTYPDAPGQTIWGQQLCDDYTVEGVVELWYFPEDMHGNDVLGDTWELINPESSITFNCPCEYECPGTGTPGYWKNHLDDWPVDIITIGGIEYIKDEAKKYLKEDKHDKTTTLFRALVSAKLNVLNGAASSCVVGTIADADAWMAAYGPVGSGVLASSDAWKTGEPLSETLDDYNNGELCAWSRDVCEEQDGEEIGKRVGLPQAVTLSQNSPNPFNPITTISFSLPSSDYVTLKIYNSIGEAVETLVDRNEYAGYHSVTWDASEYSSGIYFYRLTAGSFAETKKLMLLK